MRIAPNLAFLSSIALAALSVADPARADEGGWEKLADVRGAYATLEVYRDETHCVFSSGTKDDVLVQNEARFEMAFAGRDRFALSNLMGVDFYGNDGERTAHQYQVRRYRTIASEEPWRSAHPILGFSDIVYPLLAQLLDAPDASPFDTSIKEVAFDPGGRVLTLTIDGGAMGLASDFPARWTLDEGSDLIARYEFDFRPGLGADSPPRLVAGVCEVTPAREGDAPSPRAFKAGAGDIEVLNFALTPEQLRADEDDNGTQQALISRPAPTFSAERLSGGEFSLGDARGKVLVLDFWATWCPNCALSWAHMKKVEEAFANSEEVVFYGVNLDAENRQKIHAYLERFDIRTPQLLDPSRQISADFRVIGTPAVAVIGKDGAIREIHAGQWPSMADDLIAQIRAAAAE